VANNETVSDAINDAVLTVVVANQTTLTTTLALASVPSREEL
jgi:hypothetical protein